MNNNISTKKLREFGYLIGFGTPIIIGLFIPLLWGHSFKLWTIFVGFPSIFLAIIKPSMLFYPYKGWMALGYLLGWVNSRIIFGIVFFLVIFPIGVVMRLFNYDPLRLKKNNANSYRENKADSKIDLKRIF